MDSRMGPSHSPPPEMRGGTAANPQWSINDQFVGSDLDDGAQRLLGEVRASFAKLNSSEKVRFLQGLLLECGGRDVLGPVLRFVDPLLRRDPFAVLPSELSLRILGYIDEPKTLARASQVSRLWHLILSDDMTWKELCESHHFRRLSAAVNVSHERMANRVPSVSLESGHVDATELAEAVYNPGATRPPVPTSYRAHFKQQYSLNKAWTTGGRLAARYVINNQAVVTALIMEGQYIVIALDNNKIYVFREDGKMLRSLFGHVMGVWALCLRGDTLVSGGCDRDVRVWDLKTGQCTQILRGHSSTVRCLQMADADTALSGSRDATVRVWDVRRGVCLRVLDGHMASVRCLEVAGDICVSGSYDYTAKVWRISDGTLLHTLAGHVGQIYSLAFDGRRVATGSLDASIRVWDPETGRCLSVLQGHTSLVGQIQMRGDTLVSGGSDGTVRVWDLATYQCVQRFAAHDNSVTCLQFGDDRILTGGSDGWVQVWDLKTGQHVRDMGGPFDAVWRVAFKDEKVAILASRDGKIYMEVTSFMPPDDVRRPSEIIVPPAGSDVASSSSTIPAPDHDPRLAPSPNRNSFEKNDLLNPAHVDPHDASPLGSASPSAYDHDAMDVS